MSFGRILGSAVCVALLAGCGALIKPSRTVEQRNDRIPGNKFQAIAVIAGEDTGPGIRLSAQVREQIKFAPGALRVLSVGYGFVEQFERDALP